MDINLPEVLDEITAEFERYERALISNDVEALDAFFWESALALRYGTGENLYGHEAIKAFRAARNPAGVGRTISRTSITTYGRDFATTNIEFVREAPKIGRQSQTWVRFPQGWRIVTAHVSTMAG